MLIGFPEIIVVQNHEPISFRIAFGPHKHEFLTFNILLHVNVRKRYKKLSFLNYARSHRYILYNIHITHTLSNSISIAVKNIIGHLKSIKNIVIALPTCNNIICHS